MSKQKNGLLRPDQLRTVPTGWTDTLLICRKCSKKLSGGFGEEDRETLRQAVRGALKASGRRGSVGVLDGKCFGLCPKNAVTVALASRPGELMVVPRGMAAAILTAAMRD